MTEKIRNRKGSKEQQGTFGTCSITSVLTVPVLDFVNNHLVRICIVCGTRIHCLE